MILDWASHCEKIDQTKMLDLDDPSDNKCRYKQEIVYLVYLRRVLYLTEAECYDRWKLIQNGLASIYRDDPEQLSVQFHMLYGKSKKPWYDEIPVYTKYRPITLYQEEIDFLAGLDVPRWVRQYWGALLFYYKFAIQRTNRVQKTSTLNSWCIRHVRYKSKNYGGKCQDLITRYKMQVGVPVIEDLPARYGEIYCCYKPAFLVKEGTVVMQCFGLDEMDGFLDLIPERTKVCSQFGKSFVVGAKTKRDMCAECYTKWYAKYKADWGKAYREKCKRRQEKGNLL